MPIASARNRWSKACQWRGLIAAGALLLAGLPTPGLAGAAPCGPAEASAPAIAAGLVGALASTGPGGLAFKAPFGPPQGNLDPGFGLFLDGKREVALLTRELAEGDLGRFRLAHGGRSPLVVPVAAGAWNRFGYVDAVVVVVNRDNPLRGLSLQQVDRIFSRTHWRGGDSLLRWGQLGLTGEWRDAPIRLTGGADWQSSESARALTMRRRVLSNSGRVGGWRQASDSGTEAEVVDRVGADRFAIGFTGAGHLSPLVRSLTLDGIAASTDTARSGRYPLLRTVDMIIDAHGRTADARVVEFARWLVSDAGQSRIARQGDFAPLPKRDLRKARRLLAALRGVPACRHEP